MSDDAAVSREMEQTLLSWREEIGAHDGGRPHDEWARITVDLAIESGLEGNAAIGCLIADPDGEIVLTERNRMFTPYFRSDFHGEMVLLTRYEEERKNSSDLRGHTLVTSLEPCEMCTIRIINSGVTDVIYVAADLGKGGVTGPNTLAPHWARLAAPQNFLAADCDPRLAEIGIEVFELTIGGVTEKLMARRLH